MSSVKPTSCRDQVLSCAFEEVRVIFGSLIQGENTSCGLFVAIFVKISSVHENTSFNIGNKKK